jgi:hypothetical protein
MLLVVLSLAVTACSSTKQPQTSAAGAWELLGRKVVDFRTERDVIPVTAGEGRFSRIQLRVSENGVYVRDLRIHFRNGGVQDVDLRAAIEPGGHSRTIDLPGDDRVIERVVMTYRSASRRRAKATVSVWGGH